MKQSETIQHAWMLFAFVLSSLLIGSVACAQVQYYEINADVLENGLSTVDMIVTFVHPISEFSFNVIGRIENFQASSTAGPVNCDLDVVGISSANCNMNLTSDKRQVEISFSTPDFVRNFEDKSFFSGDFRIGADIDQIVVSVKLPRNAFLVGRNATTSMLSYPENTSLFLSEDGRSLITWRLIRIEGGQSLKFEALYQQVQGPVWFQLSSFVLIGVAVAAVFGFLFLRYFRKSKKLVLSVLDEYERQIVNLLSTEEKMKQKKIVEITNLSKAKVSRVVKSLSDRGLVDVERRGRTNLIKLKKEKLGGDVFS